MAKDERDGLSFSERIAAVLVALRLKKKNEDYTQVASEEEGRVLLGTGAPGYRDEENASAVLDTSMIPGAGRPVREKKKRGCWVCCGINWALFLQIVFFAAALWNTVKFIKWMNTTSPTGLDGMPAFSSSLGCESAPYLFNFSELNFDVPIGTELQHAFDVRGSAVGTITFAQGKPGSTEVHYTATIRSEDASLLDLVLLKYPSAVNVDEEHSKVVLTTPRTGVNSGCMRFDITIDLPSTLKGFKFNAHALAHVQFDPKANMDLDFLYATMYNTDPRNLLLPTEKIRATSMKLEIFRGWLVGQVAIVDQLVVKTQQGDGITNLKVFPAPQAAGATSTTAYFDTVGGSGRTDIDYINDRGLPHRRIESNHASSRNGDLYLTYKHAEFNGLLDVNAQSYTAQGVHGTLSAAAGEEEKPYAGNKDGGDSLVVKTPRGWLGLYF